MSVILIHGLRELGEGERPVRGLKLLMLMCRNTTVFSEAD